MPFYVNRQNLDRSSGLRDQHRFIVNSRRANYRHETALMEAAGLTVNDARIPADVWRDFDNQTMAIMSAEDGGVILRDLEPFTRNVDIGRIVSEYRRMMEGELSVRSSIDGQHAKPVDRTSYDYDGTLVLVHSTQVGRQWRELAGMRAEGYDALLDDQEEATRYVRARTVDNFVNGSPDLSYKGYQSNGIKASPNTQALDLGATGLNVDMTSPTLTLGDAQRVILGVLRGLQGDGNNAVGNVTLYVSEGIWFNLLRTANPTTSNTETILSILLRTPGVADIKQTSELTGNELIGIILSGQYIRPIVGMPVTTTPIPRVTPMDEWHIMVWGASGLQIRADGKGRSGVLYASS